MNPRVSISIAVVLLAVLACSGPAATPSTSPAETPTSMPSTSTPLPPTATSEPTEPADGSGIELLGPPEFTQQAQAALDLLASCDPEALATVDQQLESIVHSDRSGIDTGRGSFMASDVTAFAPGYSKENQVFWFAGAMVHDAHHRVQAAQGMTSNWDEMSLEERQAIEHDARAVQIEAMENCLTEIPDGSSAQAEGMISYLSGMQTGEIPCDYCEVEWADRDW